MGEGRVLAIEPPTSVGAHPVRDRSTRVTPQSATVAGRVRASAHKTNAAR